MRLVSYNTWKNEGAYADRLTAMTTGLARLRPDIVLLQECFRIPGGEADTATSMARGLGLSCAYAGARRARRPWQGGEVDSESGLAVLVRGTIGEQDRWPLPTSAAGGERLALLVRARLADGLEVVAASFHLSHLRGDEAGRRGQFETLLEHPWWRIRGVLRLAGGDANTGPDGEALVWTARHPHLCIRDLFSGEQRAPTHPVPPRSGHRGRAIDHLFLVANRDEEPGGKVAGGIALAEREGGIWASDHAAVWADLDGKREAS